MGKQFEAPAPGSLIPLSRSWTSYFVSPGALAVSGRVRRLVVGLDAAACLRNQDLRRRARAWHAFRMFADDGALLAGVSCSSALPRWSERTVELNGVVFSYFEEPDGLTVFNVAFAVAATTPKRLPSLGTLIADVADAAAIDRDHQAPCDPPLGLAGREIVLLERALASTARLWLDPDAIFPVPVSGAEWSLEVLQRQVWSGDLAALRQAIRHGRTLSSTLSWSTGKVARAPLVSHALALWLENALSGQWAIDAGWSVVDERMMRKVARALSAFPDTMLVGFDAAVDAAGNIRLSVKTVDVAAAKRASEVRSASWSLELKSAATRQADSRRWAHALRIVTLARRAPP